MDITDAIESIANAIEYGLSNKIGSGDISIPKGLFEISYSINELVSYLRTITDDDTGRLRINITGVVK